MCVKKVSNLETIVCYVPALILVGLGELNLDAVYAVDTVDEEDKDEDERNFHSIL